MTGARHQRLHEYVQEQARDAYRAAFCYDDEGWEAIHVREDLATDRLEAAVPKAYEQIQEAEPLLSGDEYPQLGRLSATTEIHENGVLLHFPEGPDRGTVITLDREVARRLVGFTDECRSILEPADGVTRE